MRLILFFLFCFLSVPVFAQLPSEKETLVRLNKHFYEIPPEDTINHAYNKLVSSLGNSAKLERIYTLNQRLRRVVLTKHTRYEDLDRVTEQYGDYNELEWRKSENLLIPKFSTEYFFNDAVVGQVVSDSRHLFRVARNGENELTPQRFNDFEPQINGPKKDWYEFVSKQFRLSTKLQPDRPEEYRIAVLVNEHGMVDKIEWANPLEGNPKVAAQYIRVVELWGNNFTPALDVFGNPVSKWLLIPFRIEGKIRYQIEFID
ncbi:hypothetical protein GCM10009119_17290 [Algoriphagus jejuensis]|uniref:TonB-like protein n=1 Tax=Algoriphagus jejuensis TaxID=419934 RepID=A0ABN1MZ49_9BACT